MFLVASLILFFSSISSSNFLTSSCSQVKHIVSYTKLLRVHSCLKFLSVSCLVRQIRQFCLPQSAPFQGLDVISRSCNLMPALSTILTLVHVRLKRFSSLALSLFANSLFLVKGTNITDFIDLLYWIFSSLDRILVFLSSVGVLILLFNFLNVLGISSSRSGQFLYHVSLLSNFFFSLV